MSKTERIQKSIYDYTETELRDELRRQAKEFTDLGNTHLMTNEGKSIDAYIEEKHLEFYFELIRLDQLTEFIMYYVYKRGILVIMIYDKNDHSIQPGQVDEIVNESIRAEIDEFIRFRIV